MTKTAPHHLELVDQLFVQGTHFWMHQLLVHSQTHSKDMDLRNTQHTLFRIK